MKLGDMQLFGGVCKLRPAPSDFLDSQVCPVPWATTIRAMRIKVWRAHTPFREAEADQLREDV